MVKRYGFDFDSKFNERDNGAYVTYGDFSELQRERDALAAEISVVDGIHDKCVFITDDDYDACPKSVQEIIRSLAVMQIPAAEAYRNLVRAEGVEIFVNGGCAYEIPHRIKNLALSFAAQLRATAPKGDSNAE